MQLTKIALCIVLATSPSVAVTLQQAEEVRDRSARMIHILNKMSRLAQTTINAIKNGDTFQLEFSTKSYSLTAGQQQDITNFYNNLKNQLETEFNGLP